jgi:hypothetical protein
MVILDSCRYDTFRDLHALNGTLEYRISRGAGTYEFLKGNLSNRSLLDTVYITANPQYNYHQEELNSEFHDVWNLWKTHWDNQLSTVHPNATTSAAIDAANTYTDKRLLIHYNQPHAPYIGETGRDLDEFAGKARKDANDHRTSFLKGLIRNIFTPYSAEEHRQAYLENLEMVLSSVKELLDNLNGRIVVTADHGQLLGERVSPLPIRYHGHRRGVHVEELLKVPWLVYYSGRRREVTADEPIGSPDNVQNDVIKDRLNNLGYVNF